jgi:hypothetical protein
MNMILFIGLACLALLCMGAFATSPNLRDALLKITRALPASTTAVTSTAIDMGNTTALASQPGNLEFLLTAPAVTTSQLPDAKTFTYKIIHSDNSDLSSPADLLSSVIVQTGAGGAGAAGATKRFRLPSDAKRYIGVVVTPSASGTGDASGASATLELLAA